jgi:lactate dehydrogenase-like 2-hydroxyacid dehydrogenase
MVPAFQPHALPTDPCYVARSSAWAAAADYQSQKDREEMSVLQVGRIEPSLANALAAKYEVLQLPDDSSRAAFVAKHGASVTAIVDFGPPGVDADLMKVLPNLGAIVHQGAGYDTIDVDGARRLGIGVSNTPNVLNDAVADAAVGLMLATMRGLCVADRQVRAGVWHRNGSVTLGRDVSGSRVGILGLGGIGSAIAARLVGFDCVIAYHNRRKVSGSPYRYVASPVELAESVDVLVVATTGGTGTEKLVGRAVLEALGPYGYVINIARGSVVDQDALVEMLVRGELAGAGLDVFADEPYVPTDLRELDNVVLTPHLGGATGRALVATRELVLRNLDEYLTHGTLTTPVVPPTNILRHAIHR